MKTCSRCGQIVPENRILRDLHEDIVEYWCVTCDKQEWDQFDQQFKPKEIQ